MKKIFTLLFILFFYSTANAAGILQGVLASAGAVTGGCTISSCSGASSCTGKSGCVFRENFDGCSSTCTSCTSGYSWTQDNGPTYNLPCNITTYASTFGTTNSAGGTATTNQLEIDTTFSAQTTIYVGFAMYITTCTTTGNYPTSFALGVGGSDEIFFSQNDACSFHMTDNTTGTTPTTLNTTTLYYIKIKGVAGTGSNATSQIWYSTDGHTWNGLGATSTLSTGAWTTGINRMYIMVYQDGMYFADFRVSASDFNFN